MTGSNWSLLLVSAEDDVTITVERAKEAQRLLHSIQCERHYRYRSKDVENEFGDMLPGSWNQWYFNT